MKPYLSRERALHPDPPTIDAVVECIAQSLFGRIIGDLADNQGCIQSVIGAHLEQSPHPPKYWILQIISPNRNILKSRSQLTNVDWICLPFLTPRGSCEMIREGISHSLSEKIRGDNIAWHRMRELYDQCLESCPAPEEAASFFLLYGKVEEKYGLTKRALGVYDKYTAYQLYIAKTIQHIGITAHTRPIYERAIAGLEDSLVDSPAAKICGEYAKMEASLHEIDRARTAYVYGAQELADPRRNPEYWGEWHEFEVSHAGNEVTFCEMLRVKRDEQAAFSTVNYNAVEMGGSGSGGDGMRLKNGDADTPLTDEQAIAMLAAEEGVEGDMDMSMVIGGGNGNNDE